MQIYDDFPSIHVADSPRQRREKIACDKGFLGVRRCNRATDSRKIHFYENTIFRKNRCFLRFSILLKSRTSAP